MTRKDIFFQRILKSELIHLIKEKTLSKFM